MVSLDYLVSQKLGYKSALLAMLWFMASFTSQHLPTYWMLPWISHNYVAYRSCWEVIDLDLYFSLIYLLSSCHQGPEGLLLPYGFATIVVWLKYGLRYHIPFFHLSLFLSCTEAGYYLLLWWLFVLLIFSK